MAWNRLVAFVGAVPLCGCTLMPRAAYNVHYDHSVRADQDGLAAEHRKLAQNAWFEAWAAGGDAVPEPGLADGFIDGFADYLDRGGSGEPPAVPPNPFRFGDAHSPAGRQSAARYIEGFAHGARAAQASGLREISLVPVFAPIRSADLPSIDPIPTVPPRPEVLPPARPVGPKPRVIDPIGHRQIGDPSPDDRRVLPPAGP